MNKKTRIIIFFAAAVFVASFFVGEYLFYKQAQENKYFTIVVLPDTQNYSSKYPEILKSQTKWIADNIKKENIVFAVQEGDIVNNFDDEKQWQNAKSAFDLLKDKIPYGLLLGNHDMSQSRESPLFKKYFPWEGEDYPLGTGYNNYQLFSLGEEKYISVDLSFCPTNDVVSWADKILKRYSDRKAIISTHGFLNAFAKRDVHLSQNQQGGCADEKNNTQYLWDKIIYPNENVFLVLSGHVHAEAMRTDKNLAGKSVFQLLADFQSRDNGGDGWMRLLQFDLSKEKIHVKTFSPYLNKYETDKNSDFVLDYSR